MFQSLRARLWLTYALIVGIVLILVMGAIVLFLARGNLIVRFQLSQTASQLFARQDIPALREGNYPQMVTRIDETIGMRTLVVDSGGKVLADSRIEEADPFPLFERLPGTPPREVSILQDQSGQTWLYTGRQIPGGNFLIVAAERQPWREVVNSQITSELTRAMIQAALIALVISLLFAYLISRWVAAPLQKMSRAAQAAADGQRAEVALEGPQEVRSLGKSFNQMTQKVHSSQQSQREFVANVSHELKTPLTSIQGFAQAILDGTTRTPESQKKAAQVIYDESGRMHRLVLDLLDLARLDAGTADLQRNGLDLAELLRKVVEQFLPMAHQAEVKLVKKIEPLPDFVGDGDRLAQVFTNLIDNGIKHTPPGGQVTLGTRRVGDWVEIAVKDSGPGIPPDEFSRIFERFYQLDKSRKGGPGHGVGLGLAIANEIIQAHGGTLAARSAEGEGSVFIVRLPAAWPDDSTLVAHRPVDL